MKMSVSIKIVIGTYPPLLIYVFIVCGWLLLYYHCRSKLAVGQRLDGLKSQNYLLSIALYRKILPTPDL